MGYRRDVGGKVVNCTLARVWVTRRKACHGEAYSQPPHIYFCLIHMRMQHLRSFIRQVLSEDLESFKKKTAALDFDAGSYDATDIEHTDDTRSRARSIKRIWAEEADHEFFSGLIKVHWFSGSGQGLKFFLTTNGRDEVSAVGYLSGESHVTPPVDGVWGKYGVALSGRVTLASNDMNKLMSGYEAGHRRYPSHFWQSTAKTFILDRNSFDVNEWGENELIVANWRPIYFIVSHEIVHLDWVRKNIEMAAEYGLPIVELESGAIFDPLSHG